MTIFIGLILLVASVVLFFGFRAGSALGRARGGFISVPLGSVGLFMILGSAITIIPAGHVGVAVLFGRVQEHSLEEGLHLINPFWTIEKMSVRTETYTMSTGTSDSIMALSADGMRMPLDITVAYRLAPVDAPTIYRHFGLGYEYKIIRAAARTAVREGASKYSSQEAYATKRDELAQEMQALLTQRVTAFMRDYSLSGSGVLIQQVMLRNVDLPDRVKAAIEEKLSAEQDALRMDFVLERERKEAERKGIEADGIKRFQDIVSQGIDEKLLRWKGIEATRELAASQNAKVVIVGGADGLPLILNTRD